MAKMTVIFPGNIEESIEKLGRQTDAVMEKVLTAAARSLKAAPPASLSNRSARPR